MQIERALETIRGRIHKLNTDILLALKNRGGITPDEVPPFSSDAVLERLKAWENKGLVFQDDEGYWRLKNYDTMIEHVDKTPTARELGLSFSQTLVVAGIKDFGTCCTIKELREVLHEWGYAVKEKHLGVIVKRLQDSGIVQRLQIPNSNYLAVVDDIQVITPVETLIKCCRTYYKNRFFLEGEKVTVPQLQKKMYNIT